MLDLKFYNKLKHTFHAQCTLHLPEIFNLIKKTCENARAAYFS